MVDSNSRKPAAVEYLEQRSILDNIPVDDKTKGKLLRRTEKAKVHIKSTAHAKLFSVLDEEQLRQMVPANRFGEAEEVAHLASFLASDKAAYITGEVININGGIYA